MSANENLKKPSGGNGAEKWQDPRGSLEERMKQPWFEAEERARRLRMYGTSFSNYLGRKLINNYPDAPDIIAYILGDDIPPKDW